MLSLFFERLLKTDRLFGVEEAKAYDIGAYPNVMVVFMAISSLDHHLSVMYIMIIT